MTCSASSSPDLTCRFRGGRASAGLHASFGLLAFAAAVATGCGGSDRSSSAPTTSRAVASCQTCHNRHGEGFVGPSLTDITKRYPNVADQIAVVTNGKANMPAFDGQLTAKQIATVVERTRTAFASGSATTTSTLPFVGPTCPPTSSP